MDSTELSQPSISQAGWREIPKQRNDTTLKPEDNDTLKGRKNAGGTRKRQTYTTR